MDNNQALIDSFAILTEKLTVFSERVLNRLDKVEQFMDGILMINDSPHSNKRTRSSKRTSENEEGNEESREIVFTPPGTVAHSAIYYEQEVARDTKWMKTHADQFTKDLQNGKWFRSQLESYLPLYSQIL
jgi:hypothetical protein